MNQEQVDLYNRIKPQDSQAAEAYVAWCDRLKALGKTQKPASSGTRGAVVGRLQEILGNLDEVVEGEARHIWLEAVTGNQSTHGLRDAQAKHILSETAYRVTHEDGSQEWVIDQDTADLIRGMMIGMIMDNKEDSMPAPQAPQGPPQQEQGSSGPPSGPGSAPTANNQPEPVDVEQRYVEQVSEAQWHQEAPLSGTVRVGRGGYEWLVTLRAGVDGEMFRGFVQILDGATRFLSEHGFEPSGGGPQNSPARASNGSSPPEQATDGVKETGTAPLEWVQTTRARSGGEQVQFQVTGFDYPMKDSRGVDFVADQIFDRDLGIQEHHIRSGFDHGDMQDWFGAALQADWQKKVKGGKTYWDVTRVSLSE